MRKDHSGAAPHVFHLSTAHPADDARVFWREAVGLAGRGFRVSLLARTDADRVREGVRVVAMPSYSSRIKRMTLGTWHALRVAFGTSADLYHAHDPELIPVLILLRLTGHKVIYDAHELLSGQVTQKHYLGSAARRAAALLARLAEWLIGRTANRIVTVNQACAEVFPAKKVSIVANYPELSHFALDAAPADAEAGGAAGGEPFFVYVGGISEQRGITELVDAMDAVDGAGLRLVGGFVPAGLEQEMERRPGWRRVDYRGRVPHEEVPALLSGAVAGLVTLLPTPNHLVSSPVKLFEYMAMGLPVISSDFPDWVALLGGVDCALFVDPENPAAIAAAMGEILADPERARAMGAAGRAAVVDTFNWEKQLDSLVDAYRRIGVTVG